MDNKDIGRVQIRGKMHRLGVQFIERTAGEIDSLRAQLAQLKAGEMAAVESMVFLVHKIRGTGATLGFIALSEQAAELEALLGDRTDAPLDANTLEQVGQGIERLAGALAEAPAAYSAR